MSKNPKILLTSYVYRPKAECLYLVPVAAAGGGGEQENLCILFHNDLRLSLTLNLAVVKFRDLYD